ncbi:MAG: GNAT family N-acetyltransferase [Acidimicrobiia bacterium]
MAHFAEYAPCGPGRRPPADLLIGAADQRHADGIAALHAAREGVSSEQSREWAQRALDRAGERSYLVVAETGGRVVGYGLAGWLDSETAPHGFYLLGIVTDPSFRRMGIAHEITLQRLDWIRERADEAFYFANAANAATIDLHARFGFREVQRASEIAGVTFDGGSGILYRAALTADPHPSASSGTWAVTVGSTGVRFSPGPGEASVAPPDAAIKAVLADGTEVTPRMELVADEDGGGFWHRFDPPLANGSVIYLNGSAIMTVGPAAP